MSLFSCFLFGLLFLLEGILKIAVHPLSPVHVRDKERVTHNSYYFTSLPLARWLSVVLKIRVQFSEDVCNFVLLSNLSNYHSPVHTLHVTDDNPRMSI